MTMSKFYDYVFTLKGTQDMPYQNVRLEIIKISCILFFFMFLVNEWYDLYIQCIFLIKLVEINFFKNMSLFYRKKPHVFRAGLNKFELIILKKKCLNLNKKLVVN